MYVVAIFVSLLMSGLSFYGVHMNAGIFIFVALVNYGILRTIK